MIRFFRVLVVLAFLVTSGIFSYVYIQRKLFSDKTVPVISIEGDIIDVSMKATDKDYLKGVTAYDEKDGDISDKIIVESIAKFSDKAVCKITYAVCDNDNHVTHAYRKIHYTDYVSPRFSLDRSLCFSMYNRFNISEIIKADDVIDGDISKNIIITSDNFESGRAGVYNVNARVSNSKGDSVSISLPLVIETSELSTPTIELTDYLIYAKPGEEIDYESMIKSVNDSFGSEIEDPDIDIDFQSDYNINTPGIYSVHFHTEDRYGRRGHSILIVVVGS